MMSLTRSRLISIIVTILITSIGHAGPLYITSPETQTQLLELYTSEGCSSCPPADHWLGNYRRDPRLWQQIVPLAFHVDYWDYLGWRDPYARKAHSQRQYRYKQHGAVKVVYTPGLVIDGREWRGWFEGEPLPSPSGVKAGVIRARLEGAQLEVSFTPTQPRREDLTLHVARLGFDLDSKVTAGENGGRTLSHNFVVLDLEASDQPPIDGVYQWHRQLREQSHTGSRAAIALWVTKADDPTPLQATGAWLPAK